MRGEIPWQHEWMTPDVLTAALTAELSGLRQMLDELRVLVRGRGTPGAGRGFHDTTT
jgi:hypothetical protein